MKKFCYLLGFLLLFYSCSEMENLPNVESSVSNVTTRAAGDGVYDVLGYGYDITDDYMGENSTRLKILDVEAFVKANPWRLCRNSVATCLPSGFLTRRRGRLKKKNLSASSIMGIKRVLST